MFEKRVKIDFKWGQKNHKKWVKIAKKIQKKMLKNGRKLK